MVSQIWLPIPVCQQFETAFNLTWNSTAELYLITEEQHARLSAQSPTFTFTMAAFADASRDGPTVNIEIPYSAFDLNISQPYVTSTKRYFPLKQAQNESQSTLGRAFLQEAYVIADYEQKQFQIGQALFPDPGVQRLNSLDPPVSLNGTGTSMGSPKAAEGCRLEQSWASQSESLGWLC